ncbi:MAG TPA: FCD domain-containing protein [Verrucomicrobiae bacterium]|jgi:GntR family transcriptional repressor for pyruvate dehydrogenase complex|nr:FCD domain-containing protein [Verrucomicrobiae bacterium]
MMPSTTLPSPVLPAVDRVVAGLMDLILGELTPGAQLPSEAELATTYDVSRLTVREAVKVLSGRGLLDLSRGRRAIVREPDGSAFGDFLAASMRHDAKGLLDLIEVRQALEIQSATLCAKRISRAGAAAIAGALAGMRAAAAEMRSGDRAGAEERYHQWDVGFHEAMALASGNRMLGHLLEAMAVPLRDSFHLSLRGHQLRGHTPEDTIAAHERIFDRIQAGDARGAAQAMRSHLREAVRDVSAALNASVPSRNATAAPGKRPDPRLSPPGNSRRGAKRPKRG